MAMSSRNVKIQLLATVSSLALVGAAQAADMARPAFKAPSAYVAAPNWTGFYVGGNLGAAWDKWTFNDANNALTDIFAPPDFFTGSKAAFTAGGQFGYNWQFGNFVAGIETDVNWVGLKNSANRPFGIQTLANSTSLNWLATVRGRFGATLTPSTLFYATGGLALAHVKDSFAIVPSFQSPITNEKTLSGYALGGGVEYMFMKDWSAKLEGLYVGLPNTTVTAIRGPDTYQTEFKHSSALVRLGINRKF